MPELTTNQIEAISKALGSLEDQMQQLKNALQAVGISAEMGIVGVYEGETMVTAEGQVHPVPANYASKTMLVSGDTLRLMLGRDGGQSKYKQIGKVDRAKAEGLLVKKDGKFEVLTDQGSFKILAAAAKYHELEPGDTVLIQFATQHSRGSWAAVERVVKRVVELGAKKVAPEEVVAAPVVEEVAQQPAVPMPVVSAMPSLMGSREKITKEVSEPAVPVMPEAPATDKGREEARVELPSKPVEVKRTEEVKEEAKKRPADKPKRPVVSGERKPESRGVVKAGSKSSGESRTERKPMAAPKAAVAERREPVKPRLDAEVQALPADQGEIVPPVIEYDDDDLF